MPTIKQQLTKCIRGFRHRDYDRTVQVANWSYQMMTGEDQREALIKYHTRESAAQKEQRVKVTSSKTQYASGKVSKFFNEVHRSDTLVDELFFTEDQDNKKLNVLRSGLKHFSEGGTLKEWLDDAYFYHNFYDPNTFQVFEWEVDEATGEILPYSLFIGAADVLDYYFKQGALQYVIIRQAKYYPLPADTNAENYKYANPEASKDEKPDPNKVPGFELQYKYTLYGVGYTCEVIVLPKKGTIDLEEFTDFTEGELPIKGETSKVLVRELTQNIDFCPAVRVGYFKDPKTKGRTFVNPLNPAEKLYDDLIRNKSEYDLTKALHGFYQKVQYVHKCQKCHGLGYTHEATGEAKCIPCKGKGHMSHEGVQDIIEFRLPDDLSQLIDLSKLIYYAQIPEYVATMQKEDVTDSLSDIFSAIFNETLFERSEVSTTATENKLNWRSVYNALHPYASNYVKVYKENISYVAQILMLGDPVNNFSITRDYNMETLDELIAQRKAAVESGAPNVVIKNIDAKILKKQHQNDPEFLDQYRAIERLRPLKDKTPSEILVITSQLALSDPLKVQWIYFMDIIEDMRLENPKIFSLPYEVQKAAFEAMTLKYRLQTKETSAENVPFLM